MSMTGRTHDLIAFTGLLCVTIVYPPANVTLGTVVAVFIANQIGGITPDIDNVSAPFWRQLPIGGLIGRVVTRMLGGHRFLTHSIIGVFLIGFVAKLFLGFIHPIMPRIDMNLVWWGFMIGILSHLIIDTFTKEGVPWLLPIPFKFGIPPFRSMRLTVGKRLETFGLFPGFVAINIFLIVRYYEVFAGILRRV